MDQTIIFDKSFEERLAEYNTILPDNTSSIKRSLSFYLDCFLDKKGWRAMWKIPRTVCNTLEIPHPTTVYVVVLDVKDFEALVQVVPAQNVNIPEQHYVPLVQLWILNKQDASLDLFIKDTANAMDVLKFFYNNIIMPWDADQDDPNWKFNNLESRLRLYYDLRSRSIPRATFEHVMALVEEATSIQNKRLALKDKNSKLSLELDVRMMEIKDEMEILQDPQLRKVIIKRQHKILPQTYLIMEQGSTSIDFLKQVLAKFPNINKTTVNSSLASTLESASANSHFILIGATHEIRSTGALELGGTLIGLNRLDTIIASTEKIMFNYIGDETLEIKNVTIDARNSNCAIFVKNGLVKLDNVDIVGDGGRGIMVKYGAKLHLTNCTIKGFSTGIIGHSGDITVTNCHLNDLNFGLKILDLCAVSMENCSINDCKYYGIIVETDKDIRETTGGFKMLDRLSNITINSLTGHGNLKADVLICRKEHVEDLFLNANLEQTILMDDTKMNGYH